MKILGVYNILCVHSQDYIGHTGQLLDTIVKVHYGPIWLDHPDKSIVVVHSISLGPYIQLHNTILFTKPRYVDHIAREKIEIGFLPSSLNREDGFCVSKSWKPHIFMKEVESLLHRILKMGFSTGP